MESIFLFYIFLFFSFVENIVVRKNLNKIEMIKEKKKKWSWYIQNISTFEHVKYQLRFTIRNYSLVLRFKAFFFIFKKRKRKKR